MNTIQTFLSQLGACSEAREYFANASSIEEVVKTCPRGDWGLWLACRLNVDKRLLTLAKGHCANTVRHLMKDPRSTAAVDAAIAYGEGRIGVDELEEARKGARDAANAYYDAYAATYAAVAAAAYHAAAAAAAYAADSAAAYAATAAAYAADAASAAARTVNQLATADICRKYLGEFIREKCIFLL